MYLADSQFAQWTTVSPVMAGRGEPRNLDNFPRQVTEFHELTNCGKLWSLAIMIKTKTCQIWIHC